MNFLGKVAYGVLVGVAGIVVGAAYIVWGAVCIAVSALAGFCAGVSFLSVMGKIGLFDDPPVGPLKVTSPEVILGSAVGLGVMIACLVYIIRKMRERESGGGQVCDPQHPNRNWE